VTDLVVRTVVRPRDGEDLKSDERLAHGAAAAATAVAADVLAAVSIVAPVDRAQRTTAAPA